tara:strand:+ start:251 stop:499 length:249 start_codon:yes stop_codon:yes gene_type:complete
MKEIDAIKMREWIKKLKTYGFTDSSISRYVGDISDRAVREFANNKRTMLSNKNHKALHEWLFWTIQEIEVMEKKKEKIKWNK